MKDWIRLKLWDCKKILTFPLALILYGLVYRNYYLRIMELKPDKWYWADILLTRCGYLGRGKK